MSSSERKTLPFGELERSSPQSSFSFGHSRSHSHNSRASSRSLFQPIRHDQVNQPHNGWQVLIPPMPKEQPKTPERTERSDTLQPNQRHSIAISPVLDQEVDDLDDFDWGYTQSNSIPCTPQTHYSHYNADVPPSVYTPNRCSPSPKLQLQYATKPRESQNESQSQSQSNHQPTNQSTNQSTNHQSTNHQSTNHQSTNHQSTNHQSTNQSNQPTNHQSTNHQSNLPTNHQSNSHTFPNFQSQPLPKPHKSGQPVKRTNPPSNQLPQTPNRSLQRQGSQRMQRQSSQRNTERVVSNSNQPQNSSQDQNSQNSPNQSVGSNLYSASHNASQGNASQSNTSQSNTSQSNTSQSNTSQSNASQSNASQGGSQFDSDSGRPPAQQIHSHVGHPSSPRKTTKKKKTCYKCEQDITGQFVRALNQAFHVECFVCHTCGAPCSAKFFPHEVKEGGVARLVGLCEYDYFKMLDLICHSCQSALRGPYITALGNKYHLEHFKCTVCQKVFESDESYYEHEGSIFCHYHYSKFYAQHCEGCHSSIVKQFVELFKGGRNQQWHPECYMVHKFWNVCIVADSVGLQKRFNLADTPVLDLKALKDRMEDGTEMDPKLLLAIEQQIESTVMKCWLTLSGYEETTAASISDMLFNAYTANQANGLLATGKLVLNVEVLFCALDHVMGMSARCHAEREVPEEYFQALKKEPRNISGKIMSYLAILRKSSQIVTSGSLSAELLSVITGCAHYLKLLIRLGLNNALKVNRLLGTSEASDSFLGMARGYEKHCGSDEVSDTQMIRAKLAVPSDATDACDGCSKSIEKMCVRLGNRRWHVKCFGCGVCDRQIPLAELGATGFMPEGTGSGIVCKDHGPEPAGFEVISDLAQLVYLLKIAISRSQAMMKVDLGRRQVQTKSEDDYTKTLDGVTELRTRRQSQKLSNSIKQNARKSVIIEAPTADKAHEMTSLDEIEEKSEKNEKSEKGTRKTSSASYLSFSQEEEELRIKRNTIREVAENEGPVVPGVKRNGSRRVSKRLTIRDEPQLRSPSTHLDRTTDLLKNEKSLTLDDIPRIVAAEQARDQRPNAFKHHNSLYQRQPSQAVRTVGQNSMSPTHVLEKLMRPEKPPKKTRYYSELTKEEHFVMRHIAVEAFVQTRGYSKDELLQLITTKKPATFWDKFRFGDKKDKHTAVFGVELSDITKKYGVESDLGVGPSKVRIPIVVDDVISALKQKDMSVEGIFRLNGNIKRLRDLTDDINRNPLKSPDFSSQTAVQLAALMKKWLRELPTPLLTHKLYGLWIASQSESNPNMRKRILQLAYCMLPRSHRSLLEVLLSFFSWVGSFAEIDEETGSKMDIHNLATVIAPNILINKSDDSNTSGDTYFLAIEVVNQLIEMHEELAIVPADLMEFYERSFDTAEISPKEVASRLDAAVKEDPNFFSQYEQNNPGDSVSSQMVHTNTISKGQSRIVYEGESSRVE